ncbi:MAG: CHAT domain-containing protein [Pirellulales bacterium]|nr:CHAT domain-containing protein [Pirellulales bacterium]
MTQPTMHARLRRFQLAAAVFAGFCLATAGKLSGADLDRRAVPPVTYYAAFHLFYDGEYKDALKQFQDEWRGAIKNVQTRWIDSICYHTMMGECYYHMGELDQALEQYTAALRLYLTFPDWMIRAQFPATVRADNANVYRQVPWGVSNRNAQPGHFPTSTLIAQGRIDNNAPFRQGGVVQQPVLFPVNVQEIVRCTALALRRRTELLGPIVEHDPITSDMIAELSRRPGPPNHWSQAWVEIPLALALIAGNKQSEAVPLLTRSTVVAGQYDHPLTCVALFELARMSLVRGAYPEAVKLFEEASYAAVLFEDYGMIEEALRYASLAQLLANRRAFYPALVPAVQWARVKNARQLQASLSLCAGENHLALGKAREASAALEETRGVMGRRTMGGGRIGARLNYLLATVFFQQRNVAAGGEALHAAMAYMQRGSHWLFQIRTVDQRFTSGRMNTRDAITPRAAMELYGLLLRDPQPVDWAMDPMESLCVLVTPHPGPFEHWFLVALGRKEFETAIEIADRGRRHRFYSSLALGGRLESLRWILEAPDGAVGTEALRQRQDLLAQYPAYQQLAQQVVQIRARLEAMPLVAETQDGLRKQTEEFNQLAAVSLQQEAILREIAVRREPAAMVFPPLRTTKEIQENMATGTALLCFFSAGSDLYGFLINNERYAYWRLKNASLLSKQIVGALREMGQFEQNREVTFKELAESAWRESARQLLDAILEGSQADFSQAFEELVIVPDGLLWYVPFEALQVKAGDQLQPLISRVRIRYAPTASLGIPDGRRPSPVAKTAVVLGKLYPRHEDAVAQTAFEDLAAAVPGSVAVKGPGLPGASSLYAGLMDRLIVLDDISLPDANPYSWAPIQIDRGKPGNALSDWLTLPWGGPSVVILPGFHTAAESGLKKVDRTAPGSEIFLSVCGLMASGARTILLSRWRTGGQSSFDLVREFTQELPHATPADAWQRAVLVAADTRINAEAEPRVKESETGQLPKADHPFFWAGYMLVDCGVPSPAAEGGNRPALELKKPGMDQPQPEQPKAGEPKADEPKADEPNADQPKREKPKSKKPSSSARKTSKQSA